MVGIIHKILCFLLPIACSSRNLQDPVSFKDCSGRNSTISVDVTPCPKLPCEFHRGTNVTVSFEFTAYVDASKITTEVYGILAGQKFPFPMDNPDACPDCSPTCPVKQGEKYKYSRIFPVKKEYPNIKVLNEWTIVDDKKNILVCFIYPVEITDNKALGRQKYETIR